MKIGNGKNMIWLLTIFTIRSKTSFIKAEDIFQINVFLQIKNPHLWLNKRLFKSSKAETIFRLKIFLLFNQTYIILTKHIESYNSHS
jgi:hypothetical protein